MKLYNGQIWYICVPVSQDDPLYPGRQWQVPSMLLHGEDSRSITHVQFCKQPAPYVPPGQTMLYHWPMNPLLCCAVSHLPELQSEPVNPLLHSHSPLIILHVPLIQGGMHSACYEMVSTIYRHRSLHIVSPWIKIIKSKHLELIKFLDYYDDTINSVLQSWHRNVPLQIRKPFVWQFK